MVFRIPGLEIPIRLGTAENVLRKSDAQGIVKRSGRQVDEFLVLLNR
jgi:hypothetical protein